MHEHTHQSGIKGYLFGFISSILLTLAAYYTTTLHLFSSVGVLITIMTLGVIQAVIQMIFFLYLGKEEKPRTNLHIFLLMLLILCIVIGGTLWIMFNLNERTMMM